MRGEAPPDPEQGWAALRAIGDEVDGGATADRTCGCAARRTRVQKVLDRTGLGAAHPVLPGSRRRPRGVLTRPGVP